MKILQNSQFWGGAPGEGHFSQLISTSNQFEILLLMFYDAIQMKQHTDHYSYINYILYVPFYGQIMIKIDENCRESARYTLFWGRG